MLVKNEVLGASPNPYDNHQPRQANDDPKNPFYCPVQTGTAALSPRSDPNLNRVPLLNEDRVPLDLHLRPLPRDCIATPHPLTVSDTTHLHRVTRSPQLHRHRRHLLHRVPHFYKHRISVNS